jgi:hypothetical protein
MKKLITVALLVCATAATHAQSTPAKKELVAKLIQLQQPGIEAMSRVIAERPVMQLMQQAGEALRTQVPQDKREATAQSLQADAQKFVEEATPIVRDKATKLAPTVIGPMLEDKFTEEELKQLIAWHENPVKKKYEAAGPEMQNAMVQKLLADAAPVLDPKLKALQDKMAGTLRTASGGGPAKPGASSAKPAAKAASK